MPPVSLPKPSIVDPKKSAFVASQARALKSASVDVRVRAAGDVLRRTSYVGSELIAEAEQVLLGVACETVRELVTAIDMSMCRDALVAAASAAFECAFAETDAEKSAHEDAALEALLRRDGVESTLFAARRRTAAAAAGDADALVVAVREAEIALARVDACLSTSVGRQLTGINGARRTCLREMDDAARAGARWFSLFVDDDDTLAALSGEKKRDLSAGALAALRASPLPDFASRHDGAAFLAAEGSALGRVVAGNATAEERAFLAARAGRDASLAKALRDADAPLVDDDAPGA